MAQLQINDTADVLMMKPSGDPDHPWLVLFYDHELQCKKWVVCYADEDGNTTQRSRKAQFQDALKHFNDTRQRRAQSAR